MMITPFSITLLTDKRRELSKDDFQKTLKCTVKKCIKSFDLDNINFVIASFSLGHHWTGAVATCYKNYSLFNEGPMWIFFYMDSLNKPYDDDDDAHMNVFLEYLHHLFEPTSYHTEPEIIELVVPPQQDMNDCGYFLVRNIGCILKGGIELMYTHLYNGMEFSDYDTRIEVHTKAVGLDYHTDSIP